MVILNKRGTSNIEDSMKCIKMSPLVNNSRRLTIIIMIANKSAIKIITLGIVMIPPDQIVINLISTSLILTH